MKHGTVTFFATRAVLLLLPVLAQAAPHNLILFVPDGLRSQIVDGTTAPTLARLREDGVDFKNSHSLFPTFTTANASAFATGHRLGDTGDFSNTIYTGFPIKALKGSSTPFLENDPVLREVNEDFSSNYLNEQSIVAAARRQGYSTALIGKLGPAAIFDVGALNGAGTLIIDDTTGTQGAEVPLPAEWKEAFTRFKVSQAAPSRGDNGSSGDNTKPGTWIPNLAQQQYFLEATVKAALPHFKETGKPFVLVFWSREPDGTQHNQGDSFHSLTPGINGPTSLSAIRNADTALASIEQALKALGLYDTTNIIVAADHGFSTISKASNTSPSRQPSTPYANKEVTPGELPPGFLAIDLVTALRATIPSLKLLDPDDGNREIDWRAGNHPSRGNAILATDPSKPQVIVAANGGSDLIYIHADVPKRQATKLAGKIVTALLEQDYVSGIFVDKARLGEFPGTLATQLIGIGGGKASTPHPAIVVNFASTKIAGCDRAPTLCAAEIADSALQQGQGMHGSFSRADTWNFMAARGPGFRTRYSDPLPASNADIGMTIAKLLDLKIEPKGPLAGRVLTEALSATAPDDPLPAVTSLTTASKPDPKHHLKTLLKSQAVGTQTYFDVGGFPNRTLGLDAP
jgi:arylsulfatase A-like enzyme